MNNDMNKMMDALGGLTGGLGQTTKLQIVGPQGDDSKNAFDESEQARSGKEVVGFVVRSGDIVDGICVLYADGTRGPQHGSSRGGREYEVRFDSGDMLATIEGKKNVSFGGGNALAGLVFVTRKNKTYGPFGERYREGNGIRLIIPEGKTVKGLCGTVNGSGNGGFLAGIGIII